MWQCKVCGAVSNEKDKPSRGHCKNAGWGMIVERVARLADTRTLRNRTYHKIGELGGKGVYGSVDHAVADELGDGMGDVFEGAMKKGIIAQRSTGDDGVKLKDGAGGKSVAFIKLTIRQGKALNFNNNTSLTAELEESDNAMFYLFDDAATRH